jgi:hypothetical protein|tara:strand:- start:242 stop:664 length:423 start_codon:yes stop_codon:yes gene_type:complete
MKLYIDGFNLPSITHIKPINTKEISFLSYFGKYKIFQNKIYLFKLEKSNEEYISNFINNINIIVSNETWKKSSEKFHLPHSCIPIEINKEVYKLDDKLKFIVERNDNKVIDYYLDSSYPLDDFCLKNEIISFLNRLNKSS